MMNTQTPSEPGAFVALRESIERGRRIAGRPDIAVGQVRLWTGSVRSPLRKAFGADSELLSLWPTADTPFPKELARETLFERIRRLECLVEAVSTAAVSAMSPSTEWRKTTNDLIQHLKSFRTQATENRKNIDHVDDVIAFIDSSIDLFGHFLNDWDRILEEVPSEVTAAHIDMLSQILSASEYHEKYCVDFKHEHIEHDLRDESMRPLLDEIYAETRDEVINYSDLHNAIPRLKTYLGKSLEKEKHGLTIEDSEILELKPNIFGIGVNINYLIKRVKQLFKKKT
jgi:hypothetical protein